VQKQKVKAKNSESEMVTLCKNSSTRMVDGSKATSSFFDRNKKKSQHVYSLKKN